MSTLHYQAGVLVAFTELGFPKTASIRALTGGLGAGLGAGIGALAAGEGHRLEGAGAGALAGAGAGALAGPALRMPLARGTARVMELSKNPFIRAEARNLKQTGSFTEQAAGGELPEKIREQIRAAARQVREQLEAKGLDPSKARIAVSGAGSTGKSTVAREIADELGLKHRDLDWEVSKLTHLLGLSRAQRKMRFAPGTVAEQIHLTNNVNPDLFDAIVRVHRAPEQVARQAIERGRGAFQLAAMDYPRLHGAIEAGFKHTEGPAVRIGKGIEMKVHPTGGFKSDVHLDAALQELGINPEGLKRHQKILSLVMEKKHRGLGGGNLPYMKFPDL
jgi:uncharacterized membrane protein